MDTAALEEATHLLAEVIPETEQLDLALALQERGEMSCGVCYPEAFREKTARVWGYVAEPANGPADVRVRQAYFVGAELVLTDLRQGRVKDRPGFKLLRKIMRCGDKLVLADEKALGTKPAYVAANIAAIEAEGVDVAFVREGFFEA